MGKHESQQHKKFPNVISKMHDKKKVKSHIRTTTLTYAINKTHITTLITSLYLRITIKE